MSNPSGRGNQVFGWNIQLHSRISRVCSWVQFQREIFETLIVININFNCLCIFISIYIHKLAFMHKEIITKLKACLDKYSTNYKCYSKLELVCIMQSDLHIYNEGANK